MVPETYPVAHLKLFLIQAGKAESIQVVTPVTQPEPESKVAELIVIVEPVDVLEVQVLPAEDNTAKAKSAVELLFDLLLLQLYTEKSNTRNKINDLFINSPIDNDFNTQRR